MLVLDITVRRGDTVIAPSFALDQPGITALFGPSGAGKTSVLLAIAGLLRPERGRISVDDTVLFDADARIDVPAEQRRVGMVFQDVRLFPHLSVAGNLDYGARRNRAGEAAISRDAVIDLLGIGPLLDRRPAQLSGGEAQRVGIGRALLARPCLLLLDEPMSSLDGARKADIIARLKQLSASVRMPMLLVSHDRDDVLALADTLVLMADGRVTAAGPLAQVYGSAAAGEDIAAVLVARVVARGDHSTTLEVEGQPLTAPPMGMALDSTVRLRLAARDLILATGPTDALSLSNRLDGVVDAIADAPAGQALVTVAVGHARLPVLVLADTVARLGLRPGLPVGVLVKGAALDQHAVFA